MRIPLIPTGVWHLAQWQGQPHLATRFCFASVPQALAWLLQVGHLAEAQQHHPVLVWSHTTVECYIRTYDANAVTEKDTALALAIQSLPRD
ncbi:MAG: 4a-hydroxytetrahydrobiopterin dehydratase [Vampirovibrionales bacterium]